MTSHRIRAYIYLFIVALIWGIAGPVIKYTLSGIDPLSFLTYRFLISTLIALFYFAVKGFHFPNFKNTLLLTLLYGILAFPAALLILFLGLEKTGVLEMSLITLLGPLLVAAGGILFFKDHVTKRERVGILIVLIGTLFSTFYPLLNGESTRIQLSGNILILIFLLIDSIATLLSKKLLRLDSSPIVLVNLGFIIGATILIPVSLFKFGFLGIVNTIVSLPIEYHLGVWYMAILSGTIAYYLWVLGHKTVEVSEAALFRYLSPIFGVILAVLWLDEKITPHFIIGAILIAIGITIAEIKKRR